MRRGWKQSLRGRTNDAGEHPWILGAGPVSCGLGCGGRIELFAAKGGQFGYVRTMFDYTEVAKATTLRASKLHSPIASFTAMAISCSEPRYRSVVWMDECPSRNLICSRSPPAFRQSFAQVRRRS